jgi:hypothetical protein
MFVMLNLLTTMKFGILGSDKLAHFAVDVIRNTEGLEVTGCYDDNYAIVKDFALHYHIVPYHTLEALYRYVDAVVVNLKSNDAFCLVEDCLKHFKHVFLVNAQHLRYESYLHLEKIAEESNVKFYAFFGLNIGLLLNNLSNNKELHYINIDHTYSSNHGIYLKGSLPALILQDVNLVLSVAHANVKKVSANGWSLVQQGSGILNVKLDFDDGSSSNLLWCNSGTREELKAVFYFKTEILHIDCVEHLINQNCIDYDGLQNTSSDYKFTDIELFQQELKLFKTSVQNNLSPTQMPDNKYKSIRVAHLIQEKINHLTSSPIFY